jgi:hypothetical protein
MPQGPLAAAVALSSGGSAALGHLGTDGSLLIASAAKSALNVTAAAVIKAGAGRLAKVIIVVVGSAGSLTLNDCATTGAAAAGNQIITVPFGSLTVGQVLALDVPITTGLVISAIPTGGQVTITYI